jgi:hypothetical protein
MRYFLALAVIASLAPCVLARDDEQTRTETVAKVKSFTDDQLRQSLDKLLSDSHFRYDPLYEPCLAEIVRHGGKMWEAFLNAKLKTLNNKQFKLTEDGKFTQSGSLYNFELLTALRRIQKRPDPLAVVLNVKGPLEATPLSLPTLKVALRNVDSEKLPLGFTEGGEYRSGRQARWRIVVRDAKGAELPERCRVSFIGGGMFQETILNYGESWETILDLRNFVKIDRPGTYSLEVVYHNTKAIADEPEIIGLLVARSKPIVLVVHPLVIELTAEERKQITEWISELNAKKRLKIVAGTYGKWAHEFVSPATPEGRILGAGVKAIPVLIDSLGDKSLSNRKRGWIFALLFSATGENDPRNADVVAGYDEQEAGWQLWGGRPGEGPSGGLGSSSEGHVFGGGIDRRSQDKLIQAWGDWFKTSVVVKQRQKNAAKKPAVADQQRPK